MKKLLSIFLLFVSFGAIAQTYDTLPIGSKPYGNQLYITPLGLIVAGTGSAKFRVIGTKKYVDSISVNYITASPATSQNAFINLRDNSIRFTQTGVTPRVQTFNGSDWTVQPTVPYQSGIKLNTESEYLAPYAHIFYLTGSGSPTRAFSLWNNTASGVVFDRLAGSTDRLLQVNATGDVFASPNDYVTQSSGTGGQIITRRTTFDGPNSFFLTDMTLNNNPDNLSLLTQNGSDGHIYRTNPSRFSLYNGMLIKGGSTAAFPKSDHLVIKADTVNRPTRMHIEPSGFIDNGLTTKLDFMMDPYDDGLASYRLFNIFPRVGAGAGLNGENGLAFLGTKSTGEHVPQYPGLHFGFNDDAADAVPMKMYYFESTAGIDWLKPMRGLWRSGMAITANDYVNVGLRLYKATGTGTTGTTKPVHTSGTVSDGSISFEYIRSVVTGSMRPTVFFGDRDLMPLHGLPDTRAQFAKNATMWNGAKLEFGSTTLNRHYDIGTNTGSDDLVLGNIANGQKLTMKSTGGIEANTSIIATNLSGTNTGDQSISIGGTAGAFTLSGGIENRLTSLYVNADNNANTMKTVMGLFPRISSTGSTNYPFSIGGSVLFQRNASSATGAFEIGKSSVNGNSDVWFRGGTGTTAWGAWDIIAGRDFVAANYTNTAANNAALALKADASAIASGTFTPTLSTSSADITTLTAINARYMRIGNTVEVSGMISFAKIGTSFNDFAINMTIPAGANFTSQYDAQGENHRDITTSPIGYISANSGSNTVSLAFRLDATNATYKMIFKYSYDVK
jgi:hypothetical protein